MKISKITTAIIIVVIIGAGIYFLKEKSATTPVTGVVPQEETEFDPNNSTFTIDDETITLVKGVSETASAPDSAITNETRYFGNEATGDLNFDGQDDTAFLVTQYTGGTGLFYYVVVALKTQNGYRTTNAFFIGDRIAPQSTNIIAGELHVNYAERKPDEPMTAQPSVGAVKLLKVTPEGVLNGLMQ